MSELAEWLEGQVSVITNDGRNLVGRLRGFDQCINVVLEECHERVYSTTSGVEQVVLGLYVVRGDNISIIGQLEQDLDSQLDFSSIRAEPLKPIVH